MEGFFNSIDGSLVFTDKRTPILRVDVCTGGQGGRPGLDVVVLTKKFIEDKEMRKAIVEDLRKALVEIERYKREEA